MKTNKALRALSLILSLAMMLSIVTVTDVTAEAADGVSYLDYNAETGEFTTETCTEYTSYTGQRNLGSEGETTWYVVENNHVFNTPSTWGSRYYYMNCYGDVRLILKDGVRVSIGAYGIKVYNGGSLTVYAQSTGSDMGELYSNGTCGEGEYFGRATGQPGIDVNGSSVTINGGRVTGQAGRNCVGIDCGGGGLCTVNGGEVVAYSRMGNIYTGPGQPEAIGGVNSNFVMNGGHVYAQNSDNDNWGYCIGCAPNYGYGNITINGGDLEVYAVVNHGHAFGGTLKVADSLCMKAGNTVSEMKYVDGYSGQAKVRIRGLVPVTEITVEPTLDLKVNGEASTLTPVYTPSDATFNDLRFVTWSSSDESIATVDANGKVTPGSVSPHQIGHATITATANNGTPDDTSDDIKATCEVTLSVVDVSGVTLDYSNIEMKTNGYPAKLVSGLGPDNASYKSFQWSSSDESVASVDQKGIVTPYKAGTAIITYTADNGSPEDTSDDKTATCKVTVTKPDMIWYSDYNVNTDSYTQKSTDDYTTLIDNISDITNYTASYNVNSLGVAGKERWYYVDHDVTFSGRVYVNGDVRLILKNGVTMTAGAGITVNRGNSFSVYAQSVDTEEAGKLICGFGSHHAGEDDSIGGGGNITINGGIISNTSGWGGSGLSGTITINGGDITIRPGDYWGKAMSGNITVNNGTVYAEGYYSPDYPAIPAGSKFTTSEKMVVFAGNEENPTNPVKDRNPVGYKYVIIREAVPVESISADDITLKVNGPTGIINTKFNPTDASFYTPAWLTFESSNTDVVTVDENGVLTPGVAGKANITITATNGTKTTADDKTTICKVTVVYIDVTAVTLDRETLGLTLNGPSDTLKATIHEDDTSNKTVVWASSDESVVTVDQNGKVTPRSLGNATITVTATNGTAETEDDKTATCTVNVTVLDVEAITLNKESIELEANGKTEKLSYSMSPDYTSYRYAGDVVWTSDNPAVATVDQTGNIRGVWEGTATITATATNGTPDDPSDDKTASCVVTVTQVHVSEAHLDQTDIDINLYRKPVTLTGTMGPDNASYKNFLWVSDNPEIATVDQYGRVSPVSAGKTTIRYIATNGSPDDTSDDVEATCEVNVFIPDEISYYFYDEQSKTLKSENTTAYSPVYADDYSWGAAGTEKWYYVDSDIAIDNGSYFNNSITVNGNVHLILADGVTINVAGGIKVTEGSSLSIHSRSLDEATMGKLITPTISENGDFTIHCGIVTVSAPNGKDAIVANTVTVNGGNLTATGDNAFHGTSGIVCTAFIINGGYVNARGGTWDPGKGIVSDTITVNGGVLDISAQFIAYTGNLTIRDDYIMVVNGNGVRDNTRIDVTNIEEETRLLQIARAHIGAPSDVTGVTLDKTSALLALGVDTVNLVPNVSPYDSYDSIVWSSSNESVAKVDQNGKVTPVAAGTATITATATNKTPDDPSDDFSATCLVTVYSKDNVSYLKYNSDTRSFTEESVTSYRSLTSDLKEWESEYDRDDAHFNDPIWLYADQDVTYGQFDDIWVDGMVYLIIKDGVTVTIPNHIFLSSGNLTIYAQSQDEATMGRLIIKSESFSNAGIFIQNTDSKLTIDGCYIECYGNEGGAGIGGSKYSDGRGTVIINGGIVKAFGGEYAAGIGGGGYYDADDWNHGGNGCDVVINGGSVIAISGGHGAKAIGGGMADNGNLPETDGTVTFKGMLVDAGDSESSAVRVTDYPANLSYNYVFIRPDPDYVAFYGISTSAENGKVTAIVNGQAVTSAEAGETVTLRVEPNQGYKLASISIEGGSAKITKTDDIIGLFRDKNIQGINTGDHDFTDLNLVVNAGGSLAIMRGSETIDTLAPSLDVSHREASNGRVFYEIIDGSAFWRFIEKDGKIITVNRTISQPDPIFYATDPDGYCSLGGGTVLTTVTEGREYTFVMPESEVSVNATFEEGAQGYRIVSDAENGKVTAIVNGQTVTSAEAGETVTLRVEPNHGYALTSISIEGGSVKITKTDDIIDLFRDKNIQGINTGDHDFTDLNLVVNESGSLAIMRGSETIDTLAPGLDFERFEASNGRVFYEIVDGPAFWRFIEKDGKIITVNRMLSQQNIIFYATDPNGYCSLGGGTVLTAVTEGSEYTFTMPDYQVEIKTKFDFADGMMAALAGNSITLDGSIGVNFYIELADSIKDSETAYMHFSIPTGSGETTKDILVKDARRAKAGDKVYYVFKCPIAAKEMTSVIKAQIIDDERAGIEYAYSVKQYADYLIEHASENEAWAAAVPVVKAMLNYGAYSQLYFDKNTDELANASLASEEKELGDVEINVTDPVTENLPEGTNFAGATLSLKSETTLSLYFTSTDTLTFSCEGYEVETASSGDYQIARIRGITAKDIGSIVTLKCNGGTVNYSPLNYCKDVLANKKYTQTLKNVAKALFLYWQAASDYSSLIPDGNVVDLSIIDNDYEAQDGDILTDSLPDEQMITVANGAKITLKDVNITSETHPCITLLGDATIVLEGTNYLKVIDASNACIEVPEGYTVTFEGSGSLDADASEAFYSAAIGSSHRKNCGNIVINGGTITAKGPEGAAAIGTGYASFDGNITINGGTVTAIGGSWCPGIGSGCWESSIGDILIKNTVTQVIATRGYDAPSSIGAGDAGSCGSITIEEGANVTQN